jgi:hypothetical protein
VIHNPKGGCVRYDLFEVFAAGQRVVLVARVAHDRATQDLILARAHSCLGRVYDLLNFNCDHLVTYALAEIATSPQLQTLGAVVFVAALGVLMHSASI